MALKKKAVAKGQVVSLKEPVGKWSGTSDDIRIDLGHLDNVFSDGQVVGTYMGRSTSSKSMVIVGDMHIGHVYSLGSPLKKLQIVNRFWESARDKLLNTRSNVFVINGEPIDGDNPRQQGEGHWENDMGMQMEVANDYIKMFKMDAIGLTRGSNYHSTRGNTNFESILTKYLDAAPILDYAPYGNIAKYFRGSQNITERNPVSHRPYRRIDDILQLSLHGITFNIIHHTGVSTSFQYAPTTIAQQILQNLIQTGRLWKKAPTITIRSHSHHFVLVEYGNSIGWVNPAWQIFSMYTLQKSMASATIGLVEVLVESNGKYTVNKILLPDKDYPKIKVINI